jgi:hypothetical protein
MVNLSEERHWLVRLASIGSERLSRWWCDTYTWVVGGCMCLLPNQARPLSLLVCK